MTESLRILGVGKGRYKEITSASSTIPRLRRGDVAGVMRNITRDFKQKKYIISGLLTDQIYADDCLFADPTISFRGAQTC